MTTPPTRSVLASKTAILALLTALAGMVAPVWPDLGDILRENAEVVLSVIGVANFLLRLISRGRVTLTGE